MSEYPCITCNINVTARAHAIACDDCGRWSHRKHTEITHQQYLQLRRGELQLEWYCTNCRNHPLNSTAEVDEEPPFDGAVSPLRSLVNDVTRPGDNVSRSIPDLSFNVTTQYEQPTPIQDQSLQDDPLDDEVPSDDGVVTYEIVESGTKRGAAKLVSSDGYTYTKGVKSGDRQYWRCSVRNKTTKCAASVKQYRDMFTPGLGGHTHPADPGATNKVKIAKKVKEVARERLFEPASVIVERVMKEIVTSDDVNLPKPANLARAANHYRRLRPDDPTDLKFELDREFIGEDFLVDDIVIEGARHIIFGTQRQLELLRQTKRWFLDGTFKVVKQPFYQLHTVHAFVKKGEDEKQVPLAYVLMSRRGKEDYVQVLRSLRRRLGEPVVEWFMLDFEAATWQAIREVFPGTIIKGCVFHLTQRIYRKINSVGLSTAYQQKGDKYQFFRKIMSLPYLPLEQIEPAFNRLMILAEEVGGPVLRVCEYVARTWINGNVWRPHNWCVFREVVRTNNDLEGWHRRINARAGNPNLGLYKLTTLLREESETVDLQIRLVSQHLLTKIRRKKYIQIHGKLHQAWDDYEEDKLTTTSLLRTISHIHSLGPTTATQHMFDDDDEL